MRYRWFFYDPERKKGSFIMSQRCYYSVSKFILIDTNPLGPGILIRILIPYIRDMDPITNIYEVWWLY